MNSEPIFPSRSITYLTYTFSAISESATSAIRNEYENCKAHNTPLDRLIIFLECYLQLTDQKLTTIHRNELFSADCAKGFVGCLLSGTLVKTSDYTIWEYSTTLIRIFRRLAPSSKQEELYDLQTKIKNTTDGFHCKEELIEAFHKLPFNEERYHHWLSWPVTDKNGKTIRLPLHQLERKLGPNFTQEFYLNSSSYFSGKRSPTVAQIKFLVDFICNYKDIKTADSLKCPEVMTTFWEKLIFNFFHTGYDCGNGNKIRTLYTHWRELRRFCARYLVEPGLVCSGQFGIPDGRGAPSASRGKTSIGTNGQEYFSKLLTPIPLEITDSKCMEEILLRLEHDHNSLRGWAENAEATTWANYEFRANISNTKEITFTAQQSFLDRDIALEQAAYNFNTHPYKNFLTRTYRYIPKPFVDSATALGLPTAGSLVPYCVLLIMEHPKITPGFLNECKIFNKKGTKIGLLNDDSILIGYKRRKGARSAQQSIALNDTSKSLIQKILAITQKPREYLREINSPDAKYLLLTTGKGFGHPHSIKSIASETCHYTRTQLADSLEIHTSLSKGECKELASRTSLTAIRASAGVLKFLRSGLLSDLAEELGHDTYRPNLIDRYLPPAISSYFRERWIRLFHEGIICEALRDSPYLLEATSFETMEQLDAFMRNHSIRHSHEETEIIDTQESFLYVGINEQIMDILWGLQLIEESALARSGHQLNLWHRLSKKIIQHVEVNSDYYPQIYDALRESKNKPRESLISRIPL